LTSHNGLQVIGYKQFRKKNLLLLSSSSISIAPVAAFVSNLRHLFRHSVYEMQYKPCSPHCTDRL